MFGVALLSGVLALAPALENTQSLHVDDGYGTHGNVRVNWSVDIDMDAIERCFGKSGEPPELTREDCIADNVKVVIQDVNVSDIKCAD